MVDSLAELPTQCWCLPQQAVPCTLTGQRWTLEKLKEFAAMEKMFTLINSTDAREVTLGELGCDEVSLPDPVPLSHEDLPYYDTSSIIFLSSLVFALTLSIIWYFFSNPL
jgi:hypothetical protein